VKEEAHPLKGWEEVTKLGALMGLGLASIAAIIVAMIMFREGFGNTMQEGRRLIDAVGAAATLPQLLAALGAVFNAAGVGAVVASLISAVVPTQYALVLLLPILLVCPCSQ